LSGFVFGDASGMGLLQNRDAATFERGRILLRLPHTGSRAPDARLHVRGARRRNAFAATSEPGQRRPPGRRLPPLGHRDQAFALRQFPSRLARASDGFRLLAGLALGRFFIRLAALHLTKNALALHLLLEHPESLIDIVVAYEYLQNVSNLLLALPSSC
jgi:hypothetical protein